MKKPIIIFRRQKSIALVIICAAVLLIGALITKERINEKNTGGDVPVFAEQGEISKPNNTIRDLLDGIIEK